MLAGLEASMDGQTFISDLRKRVVAAVLNGGMSRNEAAKRFGVGISTAINCMKREQETGSIAAIQIGGTDRGRFQASTNGSAGDRVWTSLGGRAGSARTKGRLPSRFGVCARGEAELQESVAAGERDRATSRGEGSG
jgi:hypothetical protein